VKRAKVAAAAAAARCSFILVAVPCRTLPLAVRWNPGDAQTVCSFMQPLDAFVGLPFGRLCS
jgi:hypothetical protein